MRSLRALAVAVSVAVSVAGCATRSRDIAALPTDPAAYAGRPCGRLFEQIDAVQQDAADVAYAVDARVVNNLIALGVGVTVFWPALLAMRPDGAEAAKLAQLKGRFEALTSAANAHRCGAAPAHMATARAAAMPVALGERLVYDEREGQFGAAHRLDMLLTALHRDQLEFRVERDGQELAAAWRQDLAGNALAGGGQPQPAPAMFPRRLLRRDLELGQVLSGELALAGEPRAARVRAQVVAIGPQLIAGRNFDVAVLELFGDAPLGSDGSARIDGVLAVDRQSGVLLRLELRSGNPDFVLRRRLMRIETRAEPASGQP